MRRDILRIRVLRGFLFLLAIASFSMPWYLTDFDRAGTGWEFAVEVAGWTLGLCGLPYLALIALWLLAVYRPKSRKTVWPYRAMLVVWLLLVIFLILDGFFQGAFLFIVAIAFAIAVEFYAMKLF